MPKKKSNLYPKIYSFKSLYKGYQDAKKGKRYKGEVVRFSEDLEGNLLELSKNLQNREYRSKGFKEFKLFDPKEREISAPYFRDRVVHRSLHRTLEPIFEKRFIYDSYACRPGKGTHGGADRLQYFMRKQDTKYFLKCDIRGYFDSVDHEILREEVGRKIDDEGLDWLISVLLDSYCSSKGECKGIPIGTLYSQLFANVYLDRFDHFVKQSLEVGYYIRYMDDFILLSDSKKELHHWKQIMQAWLKNNLKLDLPESKITLEPIEKGATFLGYRTFPRHRKLRKRNKLKFRRRLERQKELLKEGEISFEKIRQSINSWKGHAEHADTRRLVKKCLGELS